MIRPARAVHRFGFRQWLVGSLFAAFLIALGFFSLAQDRLDISYERRHDSFFLAEELRQSSDDLSRFARSFVTTGDARYRQHYQRVLDIRDGRAPRPPDYDNVYWDLVDTSAELPAAAVAPGVALLQLMQDAGFGAEEMRLAEAAYEASEALSVVDIAAMEALVESGPSAREKSLSMLHDRRYLEAKARVMQPLHRLHELLELRTRKEVSTAAAWAMVLRVSVALLAFADHHAGRTTGYPTERDRPYRPRGFQLTSDRPGRARPRGRQPPRLAGAYTAGARRHAIGERARRISTACQ